MEGAFLSLSLSLCGKRSGKKRRGGTKFASLKCVKGGEGREE